MVGRSAYEQLEQSGTGVIGDAVRSPKSFLGQPTPVTVAGVARTPRELVATILEHAVNETQEADPSFPFTSAVMTIPVDMDGRGRRELREAAREAGLAVHQFVHEPLAALYAYLRGDNRLTALAARLGESPVLVVDWGGGTLDLTVCRLQNQTLVQLQNRGEHRVGGDRFDELLRNFVRQEHAEAHNLAALEPMQVGASARLLTQCELAKQTLSSREDALIFVSNYLAIDGDAAHIEVEITKEDLEELAQPLIDIALDGITNTLEAARLDDQQVGLVLLTGGMSRMPMIRHALERRFGIDRVPRVEGGEDLIALGAAWIAHDRARLRLAKPFELMLADDHPAELLPAGVRLPVDEEAYPERFPVHCVDPRDGRARFVFTRPVDVGQPQPTDQRQTYAVLSLPVDPNLGPLDERINVDVMVDSNLVLTVVAHSQLSSELAAREIHQLEFGLGLGSEND